MTLSRSPAATSTATGARTHVAVFLSVWVASSAVIAAMVLTAPRLGEPSGANGMLSMGLLLGTTAALWAWLGPVPTDELVGQETTRPMAFTLTITLIVLGLLAVGLAGTAAVVGLGAGALVVLLWLREPLPGREVVVTVLLGAVAAIAGVADAWVRSDVLDGWFGVFQLPLVVLSLLAGWRLARRCGWSAAGVGPVSAVTSSGRAAVRAFLLGMGLALPWALGNVANGPVAGDDMRTLWQPVAAALQPGVAEEAWARVFLITGLYAIFAHTARPRHALLAAVLVGVYWFAYLHSPTDPLFVLGVGTVYALPMALLWLRRGLETAIGFHVALDLARYLAAYLSAQGMWFT